MPLPPPRAQLANCIWLPRILAKARGIEAGTLPPDYAARFCHPGGVDGAFLNHFNFRREDIVTAAALPDWQIEAWLLARTTPARIAEWNHVAVNLGRSGFPLADRLPIALATSYKHIDPQGKTTVFEVLEADEKIN
ncbi:MAG TPA: DUF5069 domain-containing protein [Verrucomicrobiae bacterium]|nr:DUF5069 domain-containing protein [Verrucomicrobiae bacterium]